MAPDKKNKYKTVYDLRAELAEKLRTPDLNIEEYLYLSGAGVDEPFNDYSYKDIIDAYRAGYAAGSGDTP